MTRDEILKVPAGIEMDALMAEKVMGWVLGTLGWQEKVIIPSDGRVISRIWIPVKDWHPSTNISDAWLIAEKMQDMGMFFRIKRSVEDATANYWYSALGPHTTYGETAPLAICRVALLAMEPIAVEMP